MKKMILSLAVAAFAFSVQAGDTKQCSANKAACSKEAKAACSSEAKAACSSQAKAACSSTATKASNVTKAANVSKTAGAKAKCCPSTAAKQQPIQSPKAASGS
jgi:hypothetical protein